MRNKEIRLSKSCLSQLEKNVVMDVLDREFLGMGQDVKQFEEELEKFFGRKVVCVSTGTAALQLALQAAGIGRNDEVLVQSLTYLASFQAISATGALPVACEINRSNLTIDLDDATKKLSPATKAIMPVHYSGDCGDLQAVYAFAEKHGLRVIEDAAHAFGSVYQGKKIGSRGDLVCFSFDGIKNITSGEGGCIVTDDEKALERIKDLRLLGVQKDTEKRYQGLRSWEFEVTEQGWRYHMSNIMAAIGIAQLKRCPEFFRKRQDLAALYDTLLKDINGIETFDRNYHEVVPHIYVILADSRNSLRDFLAENHIQTGIHYYPNHLLDFYRQENCSFTEDIYSRLITLPMHPDLGENEVKHICQLIMEFYAK